MLQTLLWHSAFPRSSLLSLFLLSMTDTGLPGLLLSATAADRFEAGYTGSFPSFPAFLRPQFSPLVVALIAASNPHRKCSGEDVVSQVAAAMQWGA